MSGYHNCGHIQEVKEKLSELRTKSWWRKKVSRYGVKIQHGISGMTNASTQQKRIPKSSISE